MKWVTIGYLKKAYNIGLKQDTHKAARLTCRALTVHGGRMTKKSILILLTLSCFAIAYGIVSILFNHPVFDISLDDVVGWLAMGFGLGYLPFIPGTAGAMGGIILSLAITRLHLRARLLAVATLVALAMPVCEYGSLQYGGDDDPRIVADELLVFPVTTVALPVGQHPGLLACVFIMSRLLDGIKPPPAHAAELVPGGVGIVLDDAIANGWTLLICSLGWWWYRRLLNKPQSQ